MEDVKAHLKEYTSGKIYLHTMRKVMKEGKAFLREGTCAPHEDDPGNGRVLEEVGNSGLVRV